MGVLNAPAFVCFCMTDEIIFAGHPGTVAGLDAQCLGAGVCVAQQPGRNVHGVNLGIGKGFGVRCR